MTDFGGVVPQSCLVKTVEAYRRFQEPLRYAIRAYAGRWGERAPLATADVSDRHAVAIRGLHSNRPAPRQDA